MPHALYHLNLDRWAVLGILQVKLASVLNIHSSSYLVLIILEVERFTIYEDERELIVTSVSSSSFQRQSIKANKGQRKQPNH